MMQASFESEYAAAADSVLNRTGGPAFDAVKMLKSADPAKYQPENGADYPQVRLRRRAPADRAADQGRRRARSRLCRSRRLGHARQSGLVRRPARRTGSTISAAASPRSPRDLGDRMDDIVILTMSEFGRAVAENGNRGTDHGHGNAMMIIGGQNVRGGKVYGRWPGLAREQRLRRPRPGRHDRLPQRIRGSRPGPSRCRRHAHDLPRVQQRTETRLRRLLKSSGAGIHDEAPGRGKLAPCSASWCLPRSSRLSWP